MSTIDERVAAGIALLDERTPGWRKKVDLDMLNLADGRWCIVGQVYGEFWENQHRPFKNQRRMGLDDDRAAREKLEAKLEAHGFFISWRRQPYGWQKYAGLTKAWKRAIRKRDKAQT
jgi:hypothetical protein